MRTDVNVNKWQTICSLIDVKYRRKSQQSTDDRVNGRFDVMSITCQLSYPFQKKTGHFSIKTKLLSIKDIYHMHSIQIITYSAHC